jgi:hypothetical protein
MAAVGPAKSKVCPRCKQIEALEADYCTRCGRKFQTKFDPDPNQPDRTLLVRGPQPRPAVNLDWAPALEFVRATVFAPWGLVRGLILAFDPEPQRRRLAGYAFGGMALGVLILVWGGLYAAARHRAFSRIEAEEPPEPAATRPVATRSARDDTPPSPGDEAPSGAPSSPAPDDPSLPVRLPARLSRVRPAAPPPLDTPQAAPLPAHTDVRWQAASPASPRPAAAPVTPPRPAQLPVHTPDLAAVDAYLGWINRGEEMRRRQANCSAPLVYAITLYNRADPRSSPAPQSAPLYRLTADSERAWREWRSTRPAVPSECRHLDALYTNAMNMESATTSALLQAVLRRDLPAARRLAGTDPQVLANVRRAAGQEIQEVCRLCGSRPGFGFNPSLESSLYASLMGEARRF